MFSQKKTQLFKAPVSLTTTTESNNSFISAGLQTSAETLSGNGALKYSTTGNPFVDQFTSLGSFKQPRSYSDIVKDCELLWAKDKEKAVKMIFFIRIINRKVTFFDGTQTEVSQKGGEIKYEGIMRMVWLSQKAPKIFWDNIGLFVSAGSWKDIFLMLQYDLTFNGWEGKVLDWKKMGNLILEGLKNENTSELFKKYLPQIKATKNCRTVEAQANTMIGKWICSLIFGSKEEQTGATYKQYRKLKAAGTAHEWQQLISKRQISDLDFSKIHGRALSKLVKSKFLKNQGLTEKYENWITAPETKDVKYTGFVCELFQNLNINASKGEKETVNKQFKTLVDKGGSSEQLNLIVVRDTSGSMGSNAIGIDMACGDVAKALALYFSEFLTGKFSNSWIEFNSRAEMHTWEGDNPVDKWFNDASEYVGSTKFLSVVELFALIKKKGVAEKDFPTGILCISDSEFDPAQLGDTNVDAARKILKDAGFSKEYIDNFVIVLWNLQSGYYGKDTGKKFETFGNVKNVYYFSGYSGSVISFLTNKIGTAAEVVDAALEQELIQRIKF